MSGSTTSDGGVWTKWGYIMDGNNSTSNGNYQYITRPLTFPIDIIQDTGDLDGIRTKVKTDSDFNFCLNTDGSMQLGSGSGAFDTSLYRSSAGNLTLSTTALGSPDGKLRLGSVYANSILSNTGTLNIIPANSTVSFSDSNLTFITSISSGKQSIAVATDAEVAFESGITGQTYKKLTLSGRGELNWSSGFIVPDTFLYRNTNSQIILSSTSLGNPDASLKTGTFYANTYTNNSGDLNIVSASGSNVTIRALSNTLNFKNVGNYTPFVFDLANYQLSIATDGYAADTFLKRTAGGQLTLGTFSGANNGNYVAQTFTSNGSANSVLAMSANITGNAQSSFTLDMDGQHAWSSGSANRDIWLYRDTANSLTLSTTSRGSANGTFKCGSVQATSVKSKFGASTYYNSPIVLYNQRVNVSVAAGIDGVASITLPSGLMASTGDQLVLTIEGNGTGSTNTRTIQANINGTAYEAFNLVPGTGAMWRAVYQMTRSADTTCDVVGVYWHSTVSGTFGNASKSCTSLSGGGTINLQTSVVNSGEITVRDIKIEFIPIQS